MKSIKLLLLLLVLSLPVSLISQINNLIHNAGFEDGNYPAKPDNIAQVEYLEVWKDNLKYKEKEDDDGNVGIGTIDIPSDYKFAVNGKIITEGVKVMLRNDWPDFVFTKEYKKMSLGELENYINKNNHLPDMPSASDVKKDGVDLGDMNSKLLQKIEEITLYIIEQNKQIKEQDKKIDELKREFKTIQH